MSKLLLLTVVTALAVHRVESGGHEGVRRASRKTQPDANVATSVNWHGVEDANVRRVSKTVQPDTDVNLRRAPKSAYTSAASSGLASPSLNTGCLKRFVEKLPTWSRNYGRHTRGLLAFKPGTNPLVAFVPVPKAASSTLSNQMPEWDGHSDVFHKIQNGSLVIDKDIVLFAFVRDPVARFASAYAEITKRRRDDFRAQPSARVGRTPWDPQADRNTVNLQLMQFLNDVENGWSGLPMDEHLSAQSHYLADFPAFSFIGRMEDREDWEHLRRDILHVSFSDWNHKDDNIHEQGAKRLVSDAMYGVLASRNGTDTLPSTVLGRICRLYAADYCCLGLPVPNACVGLCSE